MYKIYINDTPLFLVPTEELEQRVSTDVKHLIARYPGKAKTLFNYIDMLEKSDRFDSVTLFTPDVENLMADFCSHYRIIEAAGGQVFNSANETLFIFRHGSWDLPKGKIDTGEGIEAAALREVREETGLKKVELGTSLPVTYHTYRDKSDRRVLKKTYWFEMHTSEEALIPQTEEGIEKAVWMSLADFFSQKRVVYGNIRDLLEKVWSNE